LASCIPQGQFNVLSINLDIGYVVLENGWYVDLVKVSRTAPTAPHTQRTSGKVPFENTIKRHV
jgi:hypothetical protein